ncbi:hypothetical protein L1049_005424 [Liquidambar formosana]|uniref:Piriformospora indica-insensitive protein 2 n=1 Tax=Liquidambar formosana TaxID=63359 RepID=A0AAP0X1R2_LIQFO
MAFFSSSSSSSSSSSIPILTLTFLTTLLSILVISHQQPVLNSAEQDSVYKVLESINSAIPWRILFPDDLCSSAPHGVVCDYFDDTTAAANVTSETTTETPHITELSFGYVSDYNPNPPCSPNSTLSPSLFTSFTHLRKLFFYKCFTESQVTIPDISPGFGSTLEELVFIDNPSIVGSLSGILGNFTSLRRLVLTGNGLYGEIPDGVGDLINLEQITIAANHFSGGVPVNFGKLENLKVLDLSHNDFEGTVPDSIGRLTGLLKLDLSYNRFTGKIPEGIKILQRLEFLDLSFNRFGNFGIPLFLGEMPMLREVYLSGNLLGGEIPEIWENLGGILGLGLSGVGLVGNIPGSMGVHLRSLCYLGLDNNKLEGTVPAVLGLLEGVREMNLENNQLSGKIPFTAKFTARVGKKLRLAGNPELCVEEGLISGKNSTRLGHLRKCKKPDIPNAVLLQGGSSVQLSSSPFMILGLLVFLSLHFGN